MKRTICLIVVFLLAMGGLSLSVSPASAAGPIRLTYSNFFPPTHVQSQLAEEWCREVEKRTGGQVVVDYFPGQTLTKGNVCYDGVINGISDVGMSCLAYTRGRFPVMEVVDLPLGYPDGVTATAVANEVFQKLQPEELAETKVMYLHAHGPGLLHTRKKAVHTLEDLKGLKIRSTGTSAAVVEALGGTPVAQPMPETYQLLSKGVVDGSMYPIESNKGWKLAEVCDFVTMSRPAAYTTSFFVVMNKGRWDSLPDDVKKTIEEINREWIVKTGQAWDAIDKEGEEFLKSKGGQFVTLTDEESARWAEAVRPLLDGFVAKSNEKGLPGDMALKVALEAVGAKK